MTLLRFWWIAVGFLLAAVPMASAEEAGQERPHESVHACLRQEHAGFAPASVESVQIETTDVKGYEQFFEGILQAPVVQRLDHPQVDSIRSYCYHGVLIVVRQDFRTPRPTGWVQLNFIVPDLAPIKSTLAEAEQRLGRGQTDESRGTSIVRFREKPDVPRSRCRVNRLEVYGPEGFLVGFNQIIAGSCS